MLYINIDRCMYEMWLIYLRDQPPNWRRWRPCLREWPAIREIIRKFQLHKYNYGRSKDGNFTSKSAMVASRPARVSCRISYIIHTYIHSYIANNYRTMDIHTYIHDAIASYIVELNGFALTCNASAAASLSDTMACSCSMLESLAARVDWVCNNKIVSG